MKKYILLIAGVLILLGSCAKYPNYIEDRNFVIESDPSLFAVYPVATSVPADGGQFELKVTGNESWTVELVESNSKALNWCVVDKKQGTGADVITVTVTASSSFVKNRQIVVQLSNGTKKLRSKIIQATQVLGEDEVLINGLVWSTKNVGAPGTFVDDMEKVGQVYQFNRKTGYEFINPNPAFTEAYSNYVPSETEWVANAWTEENNPCPEGWRVPTGQEVVDLLGSTAGSMKCIRIEANTHGFKTVGLVAGIDKASEGSITKENLKSMGGIFIPKSGWLTENGVRDRDWLICIRTATSLNQNMGGLFLSDINWYTDAWGWGDGQKNRASAVRCVKKLEIED